MAPFNGYEVKLFQFKCLYCKIEKHCINNDRKSSDSDKLSRRNVQLKNLVCKTPVAEVRVRSGEIYSTQWSRAFNSDIR